MIEKCSVLTFFFHCDFITILNKCIFQLLFFSMGNFAFVAMKLKVHPIACQMESAKSPVLETQVNGVVEVGRCTFLRINRQCTHVKCNAKL